MIGENLDFELRQHLDKKGKLKLSMGLALKFCEVINKDHQYIIYQQLSSRQLTNKEKINTFEDFLNVVSVVKRVIYRNNYNVVVTLYVQSASIRLLII